MKFLSKINDFIKNNLPKESSSIDILEFGDRLFEFIEEGYYIELQETEIRNQSAYHYITGEYDFNKEVGNINKIIPNKIYFLYIYPFDKKREDNDPKEVLDKSDHILHHRDRFSNRITKLYTDIIVVDVDPNHIEFNEFVDLHYQDEDNDLYDIDYRYELAYFLTIKFYLKA